MPERLRVAAEGSRAPRADAGGTEVNEETGFRRKAAALFAVLQEQRAARTIVFCNKIDTCRAVENFLNRSLRRDERVEVLPHHAAIVEARREENLRRFLAPPAASSGGADDRLVLVCTDRASRGIDSAWVEHVVLFDMPRDPSEYMRRVGRTARGAGNAGVVTVLVLGRQVRCHAGARMRARTHKLTLSRQVVPCRCSGAGQAGQGHH